MNDMYVLDMEKMHWTAIQDNDEEHAVKGRSWHSLTAVSDTLLMLYGGLSSESRPLHDCWLFNADTFTWTEVHLPINRPRLWHSAICSAYGEGKCELKGLPIQINNILSHQFSSAVVPLKILPTFATITRIRG